MRQAITRTTENARSHRVKLPPNFFLGFDEFVSALPTPEEAPALGQELAQIQLLLNTIIEARVDAITAFHRIPHPGTVTAVGPAQAATPRVPPKPSPGPKSIEQRAIEFTIAASPTAGRKVINQIAAANQHFCIIRVLHVRNEKDKGPPREGAGETPAASIPSPSLTTKAPGALNFIVGNEKIETTAKIEFVRFTL